MKKLLALILTLALCLSFASAETVRYSDRYQAIKLAQQALAEKYGITAPMYTYFARAVSATDDGSWLVTWEPICTELVYALGMYTAVVQNDTADVSWTWDGTEVGRSWASQAWGAPQLQTCLDVVATSWNMMSCTASAALVRTLYCPDYEPIEMELWFSCYCDLPAGDAAQTPARIWTEAEAETLAREVIANEYGLSDEVAALLDCINAESFEQTAFGWQIDFWLAQNPESPIWTEMNGAYTVQFDAVNDCVWDVYYDASLSANG